MKNIFNRNNYILVDYENIQPKRLCFNQDDNVKIILFVGSHQNRIPIELVTSMQSLGSNAEYIIIKDKSKNALDFNLAFHLGELVNQDKNGKFYIISNDTGFDTLVNNLKKKDIFIVRTNIINSQLIKVDTTKEYLELIRDLRVIEDISIDKEKMNALTNKVIIEFIKRNNKPKEIIALSNLIKEICKRRVNNDEITNIINNMIKNEYISIKNKKVIYKMV